MANVATPVCARCSKPGSAENLLTVEINIGSPNHWVHGKRDCIPLYIVQTRQGDKFANVDGAWVILVDHRANATEMARDEAERIAAKRVSLVAVPA